jgi:hypothetical protein
MAENKKVYESPKIETERVDLPDAWACNVYNAGQSSGTWSGANITGAITYICN